jgi:hypothetical protein
MAKTAFDKTGQPLYGLIFGDAMTSSKGDTIKDGKGLTSNSNETTIMNRVFAFEVVCGPVNMMVYISNDQTVTKGANLTG